MQRISTNNKSIELILWLVPLVVYESLTTIYPYFPPLFGFMLAYLYVKNDEKAYFLVFIFLLFFEANHSLIIFSTWLFAWVLIKFIMPFVEDNIACRKCLYVIAAVISYTGFYFFINVFNFMLGLSSAGFEYSIVFYYIIVEALLVVALL